ncbi:hypothetical protein ACJX0J_025284, partial [Zea mays]
MFHVNFPRQRIFVFFLIILIMIVQTAIAILEKRGICDHPLMEFLLFNLLGYLFRACIWPSLSYYESYTMTGGSFGDWEPNNNQINLIGICHYTIGNMKKTAHVKDGMNGLPSRMRRRMNITTTQQLTA